MAALLDLPTYTASSRIQPVQVLIVFTALALVQSLQYSTIMHCKVARRERWEKHVLLSN